MTSSIGNSGWKSAAAAATRSRTPAPGSGGRSSTGRQAGVALITALFVTAIATIAAVAMAQRQQLDIRRTANVLEIDQAYLFALGVEAWAAEILARDRGKGASDHLGEDWAIVLPPLGVEGGVVAGRIEDLQGRFNLNNLVKDGAPSAPDIRRLQRLLKVLALDEDLAPAVADWIDGDVDPGFPNGAEDNDYLLREVPYRTPNAAMASPSELLLIRGFTPEAYQLIAPYVCALPARTPINVNTAAAPVLEALAEGLSAADAEQLIEDRGDDGYANVAAFLAHPVLKDRGAEIEDISVASDYFMISASTAYGNGRVQLRSLAARTSDARVRVVMRSQGAY